MRTRLEFAFQQSSVGALAVTLSSGLQPSLRSPLPGTTDTCPHLSPCPALPGPEELQVVCKCIMLMRMQMCHANVYANFDMQISVCKFWHANFGMQILTCKFQYANFDMQILICKFWHANFNIQILSCKFFRARPKSVRSQRVSSKARSLGTSPAPSSPRASLAPVRNKQR